MEIVEFKGWKNTARLANREIELLVTTDVGPRVVRFGYRGADNVFGEMAEQQGTQGEAEWMLRGGHRFWIAPEVDPDTYEPDNEPVACEATENGVVLRQSPGPITGVRKTLCVTLAKEANRAVLVHTLTNESDRSRELAPWALSVMTLNGLAIVPLPAHIPHPERLAHNQEWSLWGYTDFSDPRWTLGRRFILFRQDPQRGPNKLGIAHREGWVAYLAGEFLFVKRFAWKEGAAYPDGGVNFETFANEEFLEIESLGPKVMLAPGQSTTHEEQWELHRGVPACRTEDDVATHILPRVAGA